MARNRYVKDYRLVETVSESGRIKTSYEYIGREYVFAGEARQVARDRKIALAMCPALWALFIGAMIPRSFASRTTYILLPFVFTAIALGIMSDILFSVCLAKPPLEHRYADRMNNRFPSAALGAAFLPGLALIAQLLRIALGGEFESGDWVFIACAALLTAGSGCLFGFRKKLAVREA